MECEKIVLLCFSVIVFMKTQPLENLWLSMF